MGNRDDEWAAREEMNDKMDRIEAEEREAEKDALYGDDEEARERAEEQERDDRAERDAPSDEPDDYTSYNIDHYPDN